MEPVRREVSTEDFRRRLRPLLNEVERDGVVLVVKRYRVTAGILVSPEWFAAAVAALEREAAE